MTPLQIVRKALRAYVEKDRDAIESVIAQDYRFTSPLDNGLDRAAYFARCWPNSERMSDMTFIDGAESGDTAWIVYEAATSAGKRFRNAEMHRTRDGKLVATEVYFGWDLPHPAAKGGFIRDGK
jgi:ketosteroid isomerase-like protein